jgi:formate-nitrite transporter family protein
MPTSTRQEVEPPKRAASKPKSPARRQLEQDEILADQPEDIVERAALVGHERLDRSAVDILVTGFIGGIEVSLGALAAMLVLGSALDAFPRLGLYGALVLAGLAFPVGFLFVVIGRSELFTENFLIPVVSVLSHEETFGSLVLLWLLSLVGNLLGCGVLAALISVPRAIGEPVLHGYQAYAQYKLDLPWYGVLVSAMLAGMIMTVLTWLVVAARHPVAKVMIIWLGGYTLFATNLSHVVVSAAILFVGFIPTGHTLPDILGWLGLATAGNLAGGVGFVTLIRLAQAREAQRHQRGGIGILD